MTVEHPDDLDPGSHDAAGPPPSRAAGPSRRALLLGGIGAVVVVAAGGIAASSLIRPSRPVPMPTSTAPTLVSNMLAARPFTVAHRGGSTDWPEMSMFAYRNAVEAGVDALEISLARTSDGIWFGLHDATLDRTSGTTGFVASEHSWSEVQQYRITAAFTLDPDQPVQPYLRFEDLVREYGSTHPIFVDPKVAPSGALPELLDLMAELVDDPRGTFVAKGGYPDTDWATAAGDRGYRSWGHFTGADLAADSTVVDTYAPAWSMLGLDLDATEDDWTRFRSLDKPLIAHILRDATKRQLMLDRGADGLMVAGITDVLR